MIILRCSEGVPCSGECSNPTNGQTQAYYSVVLDAAAAAVALSVEQLQQRGGAFHRLGWRNVSER